jgi:hypothetical protein
MSGSSNVPMILIVKKGFGDNNRYILKKFERA